MTEMPSKKDRLGSAGMGLAHIFTLLGVTLVLLLGGYWLGVVEPRLVADHQSRATALAQAESHELAAILSRGGAEMGAELATAMDAMLLIRDPTTARPFILGIDLVVDKETLGPAAAGLEWVRGQAECPECFAAGIPLYHEATGELIGIATVYSNPAFLQDMLRVVRATLSWGAAAVLLLISLAWVGASRLVQHLSEAREAAEQADRAKGVFLATMSHEIRTPLNALLGLAQLLARADLPPELRQQVVAVRNAGDALFALISDVLDYSQIEAGRLVPAELEFDLGRLIGDTLAIFSLQAEQKGLRLEPRLDARLGARYRGDPNRIRQILINLLGNAMKFTERGGVGLAVAWEDRRVGRDWVRFSVQDSGPGIPAERLSSLFGGFLAQWGSRRPRGQGGSGLGLAISKRLAELMGGEMGAKSQPGQGSTFWVRLPLLPAPPEATPRLPEVVSPSAGGPRRLLVADDDRLSRIFLRTLLEQAGHQVELAADGLGVLEALERGPFDLVLLDLWMPNMDGCEAARRIRALPDPRLANLPILALTADVTEEAEAECRAAGINEILRKPLAVDRFQDVLRAYCP